MANTRNLTILIFPMVLSTGGRGRKPKTGMYRKSKAFYCRCDAIEKKIVRARNSQIQQAKAFHRLQDGGASRFWSLTRGVVQSLHDYSCWILGFPSSLQLIFISWYSAHHCLIWPRPDNSHGSDKNSSLFSGRSFAAVVPNASHCYVSFMYGFAVVQNTRAVCR